MSFRRKDEAEQQQLLSEESQQAISGTNCRGSADAPRSRPRQVTLIQPSRSSREIRGSPTGHVAVARLLSHGTYPPMHRPMDMTPIATFRCAALLLALVWAAGCADHARVIDKPTKDTDPMTARKPAPAGPNTVSFEQDPVYRMNQAGTQARADFHAAFGCSTSPSPSAPRRGSPRRTVIRSARFRRSDGNRRHWCWTCRASRRGRVQPGHHLDLRRLAVRLRRAEGATPGGVLGDRRLRVPHVRHNLVLDQHWSGVQEARASTRGGVRRDRRSAARRGFERGHGGRR